jgi:hypothetical protein
MRMPLLPPEGPDHFDNGHQHEGRKQWDPHADDVIKILGDVINIFRHSSLSPVADSLRTRLKIREGELVLGIRIVLVGLSARLLEQADHEHVVPPHKHRRERDRSLSLRRLDQCLCR